LGFAIWNVKEYRIKRIEIGNWGYGLGVRYQVLGFRRLTARKIQKDQIHPNPPFSKEERIQQIGGFGQTHPYAHLIINTGFQ